MTANPSFMPRYSWLKPSTESDFSIYNIPFGIGKLPDNSVVALSRIGDLVINLAALQQDGYFKSIDADLSSVFREPVLNNFIDLGKNVTNKVRERIQDLLDESNTEIQDKQVFQSKYMLGYKVVKMLMPLKVSDYTDFYSSIEHASNVGSMFRDPSNPLLPNWRHLPVAYHGRASSIVVSGHRIHRPHGQILPQGAETPVFSATKMLDFELEMAFVIGKSTELGTSVSTEKAEDHIFGFLLFNDLSARDIQSWEYVPLGPFLSKNFGSVVSPWIVTMEALEPFRTSGPEQQPVVMDYLKSEGLHSFDIHLEISIKPEGADASVVSRSNYKYLYWNICQQLAHHTVNGCNINTGDLCASGTISGPEPGSYGSMLELTWRGKNPLKVGDFERSFIEDHDTVIMRGYGRKGDIRVGFGLCETTILPVKQNA